MDSKKSDADQKSIGTIKCEVCGDDRDVSRHYGIACCYGCKAFFRRTVFEKKKYKCKEGGSCEIQKANRNKCRYCRYQRCLGAGMNDDNFREPYSKTKPKEDTNIQSPIEPSLPCTPTTSSSAKPLSPTSENLITFLKSMTKSTADTWDPRYDDLPFEEQLKAPINRYITLSEALKNPHLAVPKLKFDARFWEYDNTEFGWYQTFVTMAEWARGIPQYRMLSFEDQEVLFRMNFVTVSFPWMIIGTPDEQKENFKKMEENLDTYVTATGLAGDVLRDMPKALFHVYKTQLYKPYQEVQPDEEECLLGMAIMLFQFSESLSNEGHLICKKYKEKLYTTLYEYQMYKFPEKPELERVYRYTLLTELMHRITKVWNEESEFHLMMSTFSEINSNGFMKDLLFSKCMTKNNKKS